jgi:hypothetical protein
MIKFQEFINQITLLNNAEDLVILGKDAGVIRTDFEDYLLHQEGQAQILKIEAKEKGEVFEALDFQAIKESFYLIYNQFQERRKQQVALKTTLENENLRLKRSLILRLKEIIEGEENISAAFNAYKEIHETWKKIGDIPRDKRDEIQKEYSRILEIFFYTMKIYREIKDHDYKRNTQLKQGIIQRLQQLRNTSGAIRDLESNLRILQDEWEDIGPVAQEEWEVIKSSYWEAVRSIYDKINKHYDEQRTVLAANIDQKKALILSLSEIVAASTSELNPKTWEKTTQEVIKLQDHWKKIGAGPKKENEAVWKEFRALCDQFFDAKKAVNKDAESVFKINAEKKRALIAEVVLIQTSTDWKTAAEKIIKFQKAWKEIGNAGQRFENKLWSEFRAACDVFFNARTLANKEQDDALLVNLKAKEDLISEIENYVVSEKSKALADFKQFSQRFAALGHVPVAKKESIYNSYKKALDEKYNALKLEGNERSAVLFSVKLETINSSPDRSKLLQKERSDIKRQIDVLTSEMLQYENNLGFFAKSKGADVLRKEVEQKIDKSKEEILRLKTKLKLIPNE